MSEPRREDHLQTRQKSLPEELELSRATVAARSITNVDFSVQDVHALTFPGGYFDVVHAHQVLQHVADPVQALREMARVARPGGLGRGTRR